MEISDYNNICRLIELRDKEYNFALYEATMADAPRHFQKSKNYDKEIDKLLSKFGFNCEEELCFPPPNESQRFINRTRFIGGGLNETSILCHLASRLESKQEGLGAQFIRDWQVDQENMPLQDVWGGDGIRDIRSYYMGYIKNL